MDSHREIRILQALEQINANLGFIGETLSAWYLKEHPTPRDTSDSDEEVIYSFNRRNDGGEETDSQEDDGQED